MTTNSFGGRATLAAAGGRFEIFRLDALERRGLPVARLPYSLKILLENLLRREDGRAVTRGRRREARALGSGQSARRGDRLHAGAGAAAGLHGRARPSWISPPCATRWPQMGGDPKKVNPLLPAELVIDHSVIVDEFGTTAAFQTNAELEFQRNRERYALLRWAQQTFQGLPRRPARHRDRAPGESRVPGPRGVHDRRADAAGVPRYARRHRLPHHHGQRPRRAGLGRRRHRGGGGACSASPCRC